MRLDLRNWWAPSWFDSALLLGIRFFRSADTIALMIVIALLALVVGAGYFIAVNFWLASR